MRFDLVDLQLFVNVVEAGSLTAGAARSHLALASSSARVRGMEEALGMPLLLRGRRGVEPTPVGQTLLHHARLVLLQMEKMRGELGEFARGLKGQLRLLCNTAALSEFLPEALGAFLDRHPNLTIDLEERLSYDIVKAVSEGLADMGIVSDSVDMRGLQTFLFRPDRLVVIAAADGVHHRALGQDGVVAFSTLLDHDFIGLADDSAMQQYLGMHAARLGRPLKGARAPAQFRCRLPHGGQRRGHQRGAAGGGQPLPADDGAALPGIIRSLVGTQSDDLRAPVQ